MKKRRYYFKGKRCSKGEFKICKFLQRLDIEFEREKTFSECRSLKGNLLRFDFFIPEYNLLIEFNGLHHYKPVNNCYKYRQS